MVHIRPKGEEFQQRKDDADGFKLTAGAGPFPRNCPKKIPQAKASAGVAALTTTPYVYSKR